MTNVKRVKILGVEVITVKRVKVSGEETTVKRVKPLDVKVTL